MNEGEGSAEQNTIIGISKGRRFKPASRRYGDEREKHLPHDPLPSTDPSIWSTARPEKRTQPVFGQVPNQETNPKKGIPGQTPEPLGLIDQPEMPPAAPNQTSTDQK